MRLYSPGTGLFTSGDPLWAAQLAHSAYHYAYNNPLTFSDPTGLKPEDAITISPLMKGVPQLYGNGRDADGFRGFWRSRNYRPLAWGEEQHILWAGSSGGGRSRKTASTPAVISPFWRILQRVLPHLLKHANENLSSERSIFSIFSNQKTLYFGKNAKGHLIKHADVFGFEKEKYSPQELQKMIPDLQDAAQELFQKMELKRVGRWSDFENARFYIGEGKMIVADENDFFITAIPKTSNHWFQKATEVKWWHFIR